MIKDEQIPDKVTQRVKALVIKMRFLGTPIRDFEAREIAAAVINAWPGVVDHPETVISPRCLWLSLTQENNNADG